MPARPPGALRLKLFRALARLYPADFRRRYGAELERFLRDEWQDAQATGSPEVRFWAHCVWDAVTTAVALRCRRVAAAPRTRERAATLPVLQDARHALRGMRREPGFHLGAIIVLAVGIGATASAFSIVDGVLIRPLPYPDAERLVQVGGTFRTNAARLGPLSPRSVVDLQRNAGTLEAFAAVGRSQMVLRTERHPRELEAATVSLGYLDMLGARAWIGRLLHPGDHAAAANRVAVLEYDFWIEQYGGDAGVIGRVLDLDGRPVEVIGVLRRDFVPPARFPGEGAQLWTPMGLSWTEPSVGRFSLYGLGRLRPDVPAPDVHAEISRILTDRYVAEGMPDFVTGGAVAPLRERVLRDAGRPILLAQAGVGVLLLITCVNVASLLLARAADRRGEFAVRAAIGAHPRRVAGQLLTESVVLAFLGAILGTGAAVAGVHAFRTLSPGDLPRLQEVAVDARVLGFMVAVSAVTGVLFGLLPALQASRCSVADALDGARGGTDGRARSRLRSGLVVGEIALAVVLALASGLLANSYVRLTRVDPGFRVEGLLTMQLNLGAGYEESGSWAPLYRDVLEGARALPGVASATLTSQVPFTNDGIIANYTPEQLPAELGGDGVWVETVVIGDGFLATMDVPLVAGRAIDDRDGLGSAPVVMVNQAFVETYWPEARSPVGRLVQSGSPETGETTYEVVGVVQNVRQQLGAEPVPQLFVPLEHDPWRSMSVVVRTAGEPEALVTSLRAVVYEVDPHLPASRLATVTDLASGSLAEDRFAALLVNAFGVVALLLALVGVYGTTSYATRRRSREIGIRLALGANHRRVLGQIVRGAMLTALIGIALGVAAGLASTGVLASFLFGVTAYDPATFAGVAALVAVAAGVAAYVPARRAARMDPGRTLREGSP